MGTRNILREELSKAGRRNVRIARQSQAVLGSPWGLTAEYFLNGSNGPGGGYHIDGNLTWSEKTCCYTGELRYTWQDRMDAIEQWQDVFSWFFGSVLSGYQAQDYDLEISWKAKCTVCEKKSRYEPYSFTGWPGRTSLVPR